MILSITLKVSKTTDYLPGGNIESSILIVPYAISVTGIGSAATDSEVIFPSSASAFV